MERIYLGTVLMFFILAFAVKNIKTYMATRQSIRGDSAKVTASVLISSMIYSVLFFRLTFLGPDMIFEISIREMLLLKIFGFIFIGIGFILGILALISMKNSWRVGIKHDQQTDLITSGIYRISRNPYFLSYDILIFGYILIFPSWILIGLYLILIIIFHAMIKEEEAYLLSAHGEAYIDYQKKVNRYFTLR